MKDNERAAYENIIAQVDKAVTSPEVYADILTALKAAQDMHHRQEIDILVYSSFAGFVLFLLGILVGYLKYAC